MSADEVDATHARIAAELRHVAERFLDRDVVPPAYLRRHLTEHALRGRVLGTGYVLDRLLPYLDVARLQAALSRYPADTPEELLVHRLIRQVAHRWQWAHPEVNAFLLELWNALAGGELALTTRAAWRVRWARQRPEDSVLLGRFADEVLSLASVALPDGRVLVVSVGGDGYLRAWDGGSGLQLFATSADGAPSCVAAGLGPAGSPVAVTGDRDGSVRWWELDTGLAASGPIPAHDGPVLTVALTSRDGEPVAVTGGEDGAVRVVAPDGTVGERSLSLAGSVEAVVVLPSLVVAGDNQGLLWRWRIEDASAESFGEHPDAVRALAAAPGSGTVICGGANGWLTRWDVASGALLGTPTHLSGRPVDAVTVVGDVVVVCQDRHLTTVDLAGVPSGRRLSTGEGTIAAVSEVRLAGGQPTVLTGGRDGTVRQWEIFAEESPSVADEDTDDVTALATAADLVVTGTADGSVHVWRASDGEHLSEVAFDSRSPVCTLALAGTALVGGTFDGGLHLRRLDGTATPGPIRTDGGPLLDSATVGGRVVSVGWRGFVHVVDPQDWPAVHTVTAGDADLYGVTAVSTRSGDALAVIGDDAGVLRVLRLRDLTWVSSVACDGGAVRRVDSVELPDGQVAVVTGHADGTVRGWSLTDGRLEPSGATVGGVPGGVVSMAVTVGARGSVTVAHSGEEPVVRFADLRTGTAVGRPLPVPTTVNALAWQAGPAPALVVGGRYLTVVEPGPAAHS